MEAGTYHSAKEWSISRRFMIQACMGIKQDHISKTNAERAA
jgi:hypothetical protein